MFSLLFCCTVEGVQKFGRVYFFASFNYFTRGFQRLFKFDIYSKETNQCRQICTVYNNDVRARKTPLLGVHGRGVVWVVHNNVLYSVKFPHDRCVVPMGKLLEIAHRVLLWSM